MRLKEISKHCIFVEITDVKEISMPVKAFKKLNTGFLRKWIKMLREGDYAQTDRALCQIQSGDLKNKYCCLGVAGKMQGYTDKIMHHKLYLSSCPNLVRLPKILLEDRGINEFFASINDEQIPFPQIVDLIEEISIKLKII